jgi:hypothetical protein
MLFVIRKSSLVICTALALALSISPLLAQTARVEGTVRTLSGEPVARATIQLVNSTGTLILLRMATEDWPASRPSPMIPESLYWRTFSPAETTV